MRSRWHTCGVPDEPLIREFVVADGVTLRAAQWSSPTTASGVPLVMVHGLASNARLWDGPARLLAALGHPVVALDQRGHGRSDKPDGPYDMATVTDDLAAVLVALATDGWHRPVVLGQSWGGNVVTELAHRHPAMTRGVVAVDGGSIELARQFPDWDDCARLLSPPELLGTPAGSLRQRMQSFHPDWSDEAINGAMANMEVLADGTIRPWLTRERHMAVLRGLWEHRPSELFATIDLPVLFVSAAGTRDDAATAVKRSAIDAAVAALRRGRSVWFQPADHDLHAQKPREFAQLVHDIILEGFFS